VTRRNRTRIRSNVAELLDRTRAREHRVFAGKLDKHALGFAEKAVVLALRAPVGDFRDWAAIEAWAGTIADTLLA
jgi:menaquinone-dependent protoporphyrinogen oxidase